jgi:hypothetical protein
MMRSGSAIQVRYSGPYSARPGLAPRRFDDPIECAAERITRGDVAKS